MRVSDPVLRVEKVVTPMDISQLSSTDITCRFTMPYKESDEFLYNGEVHRIVRSGTLEVLGSYEVDDGIEYAKESVINGGPDIVMSFIRPTKITRSGVSSDIVDIRRVV